MNDVFLGQPNKIIRKSIQKRLNPYVIVTSTSGKEYVFQSKEYENKKDLTYTNYESQIRLPYNNVSELSSSSNILKIYNENPKLDNIETYGFKDCSCLTDIESESIKKIYNTAFIRCYSLSSAKFKNLADVGAQVFIQCSSLQNVEFEKVTKLNGGTFSNCTSLKSVKFGQLTSIGNSDFGSCKQLSSIDIKNVKSLGGYAFQNCFALSSVDCSELTAISDGSFFGCIELTSQNYPKVKTIGQSAFNDCHKLASVYIDVVEDIKKYAFVNCYVLKDIYMAKISKVPKLYDLNTFQNNVSIHVPRYLEESFTAAEYWKELIEAGRIHLICE